MVHCNSVCILSGIPSKISQKDSIHRWKEATIDKENYKQTIKKETRNIRGGRYRTENQKILKNNEIFIYVIIQSQIVKK